MGYHVKVDLVLIVEIYTDGVVLFMFGFFCRLDHPIQISR